MKKIGISGAFSTGKSTIIDNLELEGYTKYPEKAREVLDSWGKRPQDLTEEEFNHLQEILIVSQIERENREYNFITDATLFEILSYAEDANVSERILDMASDHIKQQVLDIIFYIPIEFEIEDDGLRHIDAEYQKVIDSRIRNKLLDNGTKYVELNGTLEERIQIIYNTLNYDRG